MAKVEMSWFRAYAEMVDDEKLRLLAFEDRWHFVALLCCKRAGLLDNGDAHDLLFRKVAVKLGLQLRELEAVAKRLGEVGLIDPATFQPLAWRQRQFESDSSTERVRACRERKRQAESAARGETVVERFSNVAETPPDTETETEDIHTPRARDPAAPPAQPPERMPLTPTPGALATRAMIEAGLSPSRVNPSHPELLAALQWVTAKELADVTRELISRGTGPPAMVYVIRTAVGRRRTAELQETSDAKTATDPNRRAAGRTPATRPSANSGMLAAIKRRRAREAAAASAGSSSAAADGANR